MRLIDADVLLDSIFKSCNTTEAIINNAPTIDAVPVVRGAWVFVGYGKPDAWDCSECDVMVGRKYNYCPNCGAYDDANFHQNVIPSMRCPECRKTSAECGVDYRPLTTKYPEGYQI